MIPLTWEQKIQACHILGDFVLRMRAPGDWYASHRWVARKEGHFLASGCVRYAETPEQAVNQHWEWLTEPKYYIVTGYGENRKAYRWEGWGWRQIDEEQERMLKSDHS